MRVDMVMPQMGESIAEGTILKWLKKEGATVEKDENILEISTDKVDSEIPAPASGRIAALLAGEGETVPVGQVIAQIETDAEAAISSGATAPPARTVEAPVRVETGPADTTPAPAPTGGPGAVTEPIPTRDGAGRFYSPLVRAIAGAEGIPLSELSRIPGAGRGGRLTKDDIMSYVAQRKGAPATLPRPLIPPGQEVRLASDAASAVVVQSPGAGIEGPAQKPSRRAPAPAGPDVVPSETRMTPDGQIDVIPMDHIRQKIAEHMVRSVATSPHVASVTEVEMTRIVRWREANKVAFEREEGFKLTYTPFFVSAVARALKEFPYLNASIDGTKILVKRFIHIGIAVAVDYGLIVPVIRNADALSFLGLARAVNDLATRARSKKLKPEEVAGGTFSITNMGTVGTLFGVPIIAQPQVGILGIGMIQKRPVVRDDAIAIREMMYMCLSYDHRLVDGAMGGAFVERVAEHLETMDLG